MHRKLWIALGAAAIVGYVFWLVGTGANLPAQAVASQADVAVRAATEISERRYVASQSEQVIISGHRELADTLGSDDIDGGEARRQYAYAMGESVPPKYMKLGKSELERLARSGDRHAARQLADMNLELGNVTRAVEGYQRAAELGSPAALSMVAALSEPDTNMYKENLQGKFGVDPPTDIPKAYIAAKVASLRGYRDAYFVLDRILNHLTRREVFRLDQLSRAEYDRLYHSYIVRYGKPPVIPLDPSGQDDFNRTLRANH